MEPVVRDGQIIGYNIDERDDEEDIVDVLANCQAGITYKSFQAGQAANAIEFKHGEKAKKLKDLAIKIGYRPAVLASYGSVAKRLTWDDIDGRLPFTIYRKASHTISDPRLLVRVLEHTRNVINDEGVDTDHIEAKIDNVEKAWKSGAPESEIEDIILEKAEPKDRDEFLESDEFGFRYSFTDADEDIAAIALEIAKQLHKKMDSIKKKKKVGTIIGRAKVKVDYTAHKEKPDENK